MISRLRHGEVEFYAAFSTPRPAPGGRWPILERFFGRCSIGVTIIRIVGDIDVKIIPECRGSRQSGLIFQRRRGSVGLNVSRRRNT